MRKVFWDDPYQTELTTTVTSINGNEITLAETIAFSFCGGQESDTAYINGLLVSDSKIMGPLIYYTLPDNHGLKVGESVKMSIDWPRRHQLMRLHFAAELILELLVRKLGLEKIGAHIAATKARIDFFCEQNISTVFEDILAEYNHLISSDLPIEKGFSDVDTQRRYWKIAGFAEVPCGGTHVKSTAEVGYVRLKRKNVGAGKERIEITLINS
jgi:Ser-tRNA(Ala) deacylase AlaX